MSITPTNIVERGLDRTTSYFSAKENFLRFLAIYLEELQEVSNALADLSNIKDLSSVTGVWLDYIGKIVGEIRSGRSDSNYRKALQLRVAINTSDGTAPVIYEILKTYTESDKIRIAEGILSYGQIILNGTVNVDLSLTELLQEIQPVTTKTLILQDTNNSCFFPAYEWKLTNVELFKVVIGGIPDTLELVLNSTLPPEPFYVSTSEEQGTYDPDTLGAQFWGWEEDEPFYLNTGELFEVVINGVASPFSVATGAGSSDDILFPWEINEDTMIGIIEPSEVGTYVSGTTYIVETLVDGLKRTLESRINEEL